jgi:hypothetical protein
VCRAARDSSGSQAKRPSACFVVRFQLALAAQSLVRGQPVDGVAGIPAPVSVCDDSLVSQGSQRDTTRPQVLQLDPQLSIHDHWPTHDSTHFGHLARRIPADDRHAWLDAVDIPDRPGHVGRPGSVGAELSTPVHLIQEIILGPHRILVAFVVVRQTVHFDTSFRYTLEPHDCEAIVSYHNLIHMSIAQQCCKGSKCNHCRNQDKQEFPTQPHPISDTSQRVPL